MPYEEPPETGPQRNPYRKSNREYVPAEWNAAHGPTESPKVSGGYEQQKGTVKAAPRGLNRVDQRYNLSATEMIARREARAADEYADSLVLWSENGLLEVCSKSGKSLNVAPSIGAAWPGQFPEPHLCQCEDDFRLRASGYQLNVRCKHYLIGQMAIDNELTDPIFYSAERLAQDTNYAIRTIEALCRQEVIPAVKVKEKWCIVPGDYANTVSTLIQRVWPNYL